MTKKQILFQISGIQRRRELDFRRSISDGVKRRGGDGEARTIVMVGLDVHTVAYTMSKWLK